MLGGLLLILGGNGLSTAMCSSIHRLFGIEKVAKDFRGSDAAAKAWLREDFAYRNNVRLRKFKNPRFALSLKLCRKIAARQARGYGVLYEVKPVWQKCYF